MTEEMLPLKTIEENDSNRFTITDDLDKVIEIIKSTPVRVSIPFDHAEVDKKVDIAY